MQLHLSQWKNSQKKILLKLHYAASFSDHTFEGKSIIELAEEKNIEPPFMMEIITAKPIHLVQKQNLVELNLPRKKFISTQIKL